MGWHRTNLKMRKLNLSERRVTYCVFFASIATCLHQGLANTITTSWRDGQTSPTILLFLWKQICSGSIRWNKEDTEKQWRCSFTILHGFCFTLLLTPLTQLMRYSDMENAKELDEASGWRLGRPTSCFNNCMKLIRLHGYRTQDSTTLTRNPYYRSSLCLD